jgi:hypothetical protein
MTHNRKLALLWIAALAVCAVAISTQARQIISVTPVPSSSPKPVKTHFEVMHMLSNSIQVRSRVNGLEVRTFVYSDRIRDRMQTMLNNGGYQYGDKVLIWYQPGTDVALRIKGKPSKPL